jgi:hypothetical protein
MKVIFFLDRTDETGKVVEENVRALEVLPTQLQMRQVEEFKTWLSFPVGDQSDPKTAKFVPLISFPVGLKQPAPVPPVPEVKQRQKPGPKPKAKAAAVPVPKA